MLIVIFFSHQKMIAAASPGYNMYLGSSLRADLGCSSWSSKFVHCVGVIHTNYKAYAREHAPAGFLAAPLLAGVNSMVVQANCHRVVKLSGVLQEFAPFSECIENVHGIRDTFLKEGKRRKMSSSSSTTTTSVRSRRRIYFIGKLLWAKGFDQLLELESSYRERSGDFFEIDIFGSGPDELEIRRAFSGGDAGGADDNGIGILHSLNKKWSSSDLNKKWSSSDLHRKLSSTDLHKKWSGGRRLRLPANFKGKVDHSALAGDEYSIFVNPSLTEVLCTTTAEAIAMGKWAIVPSHPSNAFFVQFPNCLPYRNRREFVSTLRYALNNDPPHLSEELSSLLSWEAATARCVSAAAISKREESRNCRLFRAKEEKTLKKTLSGLMNSVRTTSSSPTNSEKSVCVGTSVP
jgi:digalactosyldiacylglycerol synthase